MPHDSRNDTVDRVCQQLLLLAPAERPAYLATHCTDPVLRSAVLRRLDGATQTLASRPAAVPDIASGTRLGRYRIVRILGSGGMGRVYEAVDETLNRPVAIKLLPAGSQDENSRARLRREASAASALNHPSIVTVHEVGCENGIDFIAMERVAGQTLADMVQSRALPVKQVVAIARQVADALATAHEAGIVHRDLKPSNVMISERGLVKVLDFGLAKSVLTAGPEAPTADLTERGHIVGTVSYMSPEQAQGRLVDSRSDVFSFGVLCYELLAGRRPFQRDTTVATLAAILETEPAPLRQIRADVPKPLEAMVMRCLRKPPHERWQSLADVKLLLEEDAYVTTEAPAGEPAPRRSWIAWAGAAAATASLLTLGVERFLVRPVSGPAQAVAAPAELRRVTAEYGLSTAPVLSGDGSFVAFASDRFNQSGLDIWIQQIGGSGEPIRLTTDPGDESDPCFSPDGTRIAFRSDKDGGGIYVVPALGGDAVLIAPRGRNPRFSPDGKTIAYWEGREGSAVSGASKAFLIDASGGGTPKPVAPELAWAQFPVWSPDGTALVVLGGAAGGTEDWWVTAAAGGGPARAAGIREALRPLRPRRLPAVLDWVLNDAGNGAEALFAADTGDASNLWRLDLSAAGQTSRVPVRISRGPGRHVRASFSRTKEGLRRMTYADETLNYDVWRLPVMASTGVAAGPLEAVTNRLTAETNPSLSGDGRTAYFITARLGGWSLIRKELDGSGRERTLHSSPTLILNSRAAARGSTVYFSSRSADLLSVPAGGGAVSTLCTRCGYVMGVSPTGDRVLIAPMEHEDLRLFDVAARRPATLAPRGSQDVMLDGGQFSPDGQWVAFQEMNTRTRESSIYVIPLDDKLPVPRERWIAVTEGSETALDPYWSPSGSHLYFTSDRDGYRCVWARRLDPRTHAPVGPAFAAQHLHSARLALRNRASSGNIVSVSAGGAYLAFALTSTTGNIWLEDMPIAK